MKQIASALRSLRSGEGLKGQLMRGGVGSVAVKIAGVAISLLSAILLARLLGPEQFGIYSLVLAIVTLLTVPAQFGLPNLVVRETAMAHANADWPRMKGIWRWSSAVALAFSAILIVAAIGAVSIVDTSRFGGERTVFLFALPLIPLLALGKLRSAALRGLRKVVQGLLPEHVLRPGLIVIFVIIAWAITSSPLTAVDAMVYNVLAAALSFILGATILMRYRPAEMLASRGSRYEGRTWLISIFPLALNEATHQITKQTDIVMLGFYTAPEEIGIYRVAVQGATMVAFGLSAGNLVIAPYFARFHARADKLAIQRLATYSAQLITLLALPPFLALLFFGHEIVSVIFGYKYAGSVLPMAVLSAGQLVNAFTGTAGMLLLMAGYEKTTSFVATGTMTVNIILNALLIPCFGINGAAMATAIVLAFHNALLCLLLYRRMGINTTALPLRQ